MGSGCVTPRTFFGTAALVFVISATVTIMWCASMVDMPGMPMPGGWTMSMAWMRMPDQTWLGAGASFLSMWSVMMVAMMLPTVTSNLWRLRQCISRNATPHPAIHILVTACGYFFIWSVVGVLIYVIGVTWAGLTMRLPAVASAVPLLSGCVVFAAGIFQFTGIKSYWLACCRMLPKHFYLLPINLETAWIYGARLGAHCVGACAGFTALLLVFGVMDLSAMAVVTTAITVERFARVEKVLGALLCVGGAFLSIKILI